MDLNTILIILGVAALVILVIHGIWSSRREESRYCKSAETFTNDSRLQNRNQFSDDVLPPEAISSSQSSPIFDERQQPLRFGAENTDNFELPEINTLVVNEQMTSPLSSISSISKENDFAHFNDQEYGITPHSTELRDQFAEFGRNNTSVVEEAVKQAVIEPVLDTKKVMKAEYLMLYVVAAEGAVFQGAKLAKILDELGFLFGEKQIYHRHSDLNINSPILFSVANIEVPGTFHYNMQDFSTIGVALFIQFPSEGNDLMNLRMMIQTAKNIAEELEGFVLTEEQKIFDEQEEKRYLDLIR